MNGKLYVVARRTRLSESEANEAQQDLVAERERVGRVFPACSGPCNQGRRICITPEACRIPEHALPSARVTALALALAFFIVAVCALVVWGAER